MTFDTLDNLRIENAVMAFLTKRRPPPHMRPELDIGYRLIKQSVEIFEIRPQWDNPTIRLEHAVAKATYVKTQNLWKVFWQPSDMKWHGYEPTPTVTSIEAFLAIVDADPYGCFFG